MPFSMASLCPSNQRQELKPGAWVGINNLDTSTGTAKRVSALRPDAARQATIRPRLQTILPTLRHPIRDKQLLLGDSPTAVALAPALAAALATALAFAALVGTTVLPLRAARRIGCGHRLLRELESRGLVASIDTSLALTTSLLRKLNEMVDRGVFRKLRDQELVLGQLHCVLGQHQLVLQAGHAEVGRRRILAQVLAEIEAGMLLWDARAVGVIHIVLEARREQEQLEAQLHQGPILRGELLEERHSVATSFTS